MIDGTCRVTGKRRFPSRRLAAHCLKTLKINSRRQYIPKRAYHCRHCEGWHLTSQETDMSDENRTSR